MATIKPERRVAFIAGCGIFLISSLGGFAALAHASAHGGEPSFSTKAFHICAVNWALALIAAGLVAFGRGWQRIVAEVLAVSTLLYWSALLLIGD